MDRIISKRFSVDESSNRETYQNIGFEIGIPLFFAKKSGAFRPRAMRLHLALGVWRDGGSDEVTAVEAVLDVSRKDQS